MIARLMCDISEVLRELGLRPGVFVAKARVDRSTLYSYPDTRDVISSVFYGSMLYAVGYEMRPPFYYTPVDPERTLSGTHHLRIDQDMIRELAQSIPAIGKRKYIHNLNKLIGDTRSPTQVRNFFHYTRDDQAFYLHDRDFIGSLLAILGINPPAPFWLLRGEPYNQWIKDHKPND